MGPSSDINERLPAEARQRFEVGEMLGSGGQASTFLARDRQSGEHVAVKELVLEDVEDWKAVELFEREAGALERLDHPAIPRYVDSFRGDEADGVHFYLVQEFVPGTDLEQYVSRHGPLSEEEAAAVRDAVLDVLDYLHGFHPPVLHRDIKPANLIRTEDGRIVLVDFGAVQETSTKTVGGSTVVGTAGYMPIEQYMGRALPASDLYALGATIVHLLTGRPPSELPTNENRLLFEDYVGVSDRFRRGLGALLEPAAERRPQSVAAARRAFEGDDLSTTNGNNREMSSDGKSAMRTYLLAGFLLAAAGAATVVYLVTTGQMRGSTVDIDNIYAEEPSNAMRVLFLGNSHTYWWSVPRMVAQMVPEEEPRKLWFDARVSPGVTLRWHLENGADDAIADGDWDAISIQPQSAEPITQGRRFGAALTRLEELSHRHGAEPIVWTPWARHPEYDIYGFYEGERGFDSYEQLSDRLVKGVRTWTNRSEICPIGQAWSEARRRFPEAPLHQESNGNSATHVGAYLTSLVLFSCIYDRDPSHVGWVVEGLAPESAAKLRNIASTTVKQHGVISSGER